mmetsp:Transcript_59591/g.167872  ORF Transcript_59591/g.167872 Transcript_59591/m.167872 type:complete len:256 (-) Transcript_59591:23-790(-)
MCTPCDITGSDADALKPSHACGPCDSQYGADPPSRVLTPVTLILYDLGLSGKMLNSILRPLGTGMYHCGVCVYGWEWGFTSTPDPDTGTGVFSCCPCKCEHFIFRETVPIGATILTRSEVQRIIEWFDRRWPACAYDALKRNCVHFSEDLCRMLGVGPIPPYIRNLMDTGLRLDNGVNYLTSQFFLCCEDAEDDEVDHEVVHTIQVISDGDFSHNYTPRNLTRISSNATYSPATPSRTPRSNATYSPAIPSRTPR